MKPWIVAALVGAGLVVGLIRPGIEGSVFPFATFYVLLPALIFEAAWQLDAATMRKMWRPIVLLALPGVLATAAIVAIAAHFMGGLALPAALLLGAILSATDPVAVVAVFRRLKLPKGLETIVESESLLNDGVAVLIYRAVLLGAIGGFSVASIGVVAIGALAGALMGVACGAVVGIAAGVTARASATPVRMAVTLVGAYGSYAAANAFGWSGIFAVIACAMAMRTIFARVGVNGQEEDQAWNDLATAANVVLFIGIGAAVQLESFARSWPAVLAALGAVVLARIVLALALRLIVPSLPGTWSAVIGLAGLRGALALALALALPIAMTDRQTIIDTTFAVVIITLMIGGVSERSIFRMIRS